MIKTRTVFVLGAGASAPYGFPLGAELRTQICAITANPTSTKLGNVVLALGGVNTTEVASFGEAFTRSSIASIDTFLSKRPQFTNVGKLLIAAILCTREVPDKLFSDGLQDHWYKLLWNALLVDAEKPVDISRNTVRFIAFNYDRSLKYFLHEAIKHSFGINDEATYTVTDRIHILHVYGSIGTLSARPQTGFRIYGEPLNHESIKLAVESIHVIPEHRGDTAFTEAAKYFDWAERICFLGFGFDPLNMQRLGLSTLLNHKRASGNPLPKFYATTIGRTEVESVEDRRRLLGEPFTDVDWRPYLMNCSDTLRNTPLLFG